MERLRQQLLEASAPKKRRFRGSACETSEIEQLSGSLRPTDYGALARARQAHSAAGAALAAVRTLDVIVANHLASDPVTQAVWRRDRRVVYPHRSRKAVATPAPSR